MSHCILMVCALTDQYGWSDDQSLQNKLRERMRNNHYANVVTVASCLVISGWALAKSNVLGFPQEPEKVILQDVPIIGKDPLEITEIKVKGKAVKVAEKFVEDVEWLNDATFKLTNTYSKPITYIQINVDFPEIMRPENGAVLQH